ncbi:MAG: hypothetical protein CMN79_04105 [Spirochaetales bacterium]|nr:hypothetical protein [Spirochaetales bacterium]|tara:strand:+ start:2137 stop:2592 length:456 start_codon:yes stop_codon:yes gene_type:complete
MDIKKFLQFEFLKFIFFSLEGRINRQTWWYSKIFLYVISILLSLPAALVVRELNLDENQTTRVISFLFLVFSAFGVFVDAKRLQDKSINGLLAIVPYVMTIPYHFFLIPESIVGPYGLAIVAIEIYIFINVGFLKGNDGSNKYGDLDDFSS